MIFMWLLARNSRGTGPKDTRADRLFLVVDQDGCIPVEPDHAAIGAANVLSCPNDNRLHHITLLDAAARNGFLDRDDDDVADGSIFPLGTAQNLDAHDTTGAGIIRDVEVCLHLNHIRPPSCCYRHGWGTKGPLCQLMSQYFLRGKEWCQGGFPKGTFHALKAEERPLPGRSVPMACFIQDSRQGASAALPQISSFRPGRSRRQSSTCPWKWARIPGWKPGRPPCTDCFRHAPCSSWCDETIFCMTGCAKRRSTRTTTVFSFLSLTTVPCRMRFGISYGP